MIKDNLPKQTIENLRGEILFREKLARQHVDNEILLPDYCNKEEHDKILLDRMNTTYHAMQELKDQGLVLSPFIELGAERGQRSLVLRNDFGADGFAIDISFAQLGTMTHFAELFGKKELPVRVCCDAYHLPFRNGSFPFAFCYEFLHHFPTPIPIVREIFRILSDGYFFFDEEPFKRMIQLKLYQQKHKIYSQKRLGRNRLVRCIESFISEPYYDEVEHGILENHNLSLEEWNTALSVFEEKHVRLTSAAGKISSELGRKVNLSNFFSFVLGGTISGLCHKVSQLDKTHVDIYNLLGCPDCTIPIKNQGYDRAPLSRHPGFMKCDSCGSEFPIVDDIIILLPREEFRQLYPQFMRHRR